METSVYIKNIDSYIIIDTEDKDKIEHHNWYITYAHNTIRCQTMVNFKRSSLPRFITGIENSYQKVKGLDFRRCNIGIDPYKNARGSKKFRADISVFGKRIFLERYDETDSNCI